MNWDAMLERAADRIERLREKETVAAGARKRRGRDAAAGEP